MCFSRFIDLFQASHPNDAGGQFPWPGAKALRKEQQTLVDALNLKGCSGRCKDCTSRCGPTFNLTRCFGRKFRFFPHKMTGRFSVTKCSLGQNLERGV
jgi:hypothetical protein